LWGGPWGDVRVPDGAQRGGYNPACFVVPSSSYIVKKVAAKNRRLSY
jgi:hypothetical protein